MNISCTFGMVKEVNKNLHFDFFLGGWTIHYRFWFCVHGTWTMDAYICLWWLQWKFSMRLWLHNYRMYIYALGTQNLNVLKENSSNFICIVLLDTQYTQVTFLVLHVTFFVMDTEYHFVLFSCYFHFLFCYIQKRSGCYGNVSFSYFLLLPLFMIYVKLVFSDKVWGKFQQKQVSKRTLTKEDY